MPPKLSQPIPQSPAAIIGIGCLFPRAPQLQAFWRLVRTGTDAIGEVPPSHWSPEDYFDPDPAAPDRTYCKRGGFLDPSPFDPTEFGIPPNTLEATDTSQLLGLLAARNALADAGYGRERAFDRRRVSVVLGVTGTQELVIPLGARLGHPHWRRALRTAGLPAEKVDAIVAAIAAAYVPWQENSFPGLLGNVVAGRISNRLDLGGTNCVVDAACASSIGAIHLALLELETRRADMVVTGGVDTLNDIFMHMCFAKTGVLSPTGDIRPFAADADGTVLGEGIGLLVLKRLEAAERDKDRIYAVIRGVGSASDGRSQSIYAPRAEGQAEALQAAYEHARVSPASVELLEAHGTGTRVGDKVECEALRQVFQAAQAPVGACALGSIKSMIGHTKAAAGAAGLIKAALALYHKVLPPTIKVARPDPDLRLATSPFYLNTTLRPWLAHPDHPRRAGVSAFGFGGSNFHVVLEEHRPVKTEVAWDGEVDILAFGAENRDALQARLQAFKGGLPKAPDPARIAALAAETRDAFPQQAACRLLALLRPPETSASDSGAVGTLLDTAMAIVAHTGATPAPRHPDIFFGTQAPPGKLAFVFPGQGSQYVGMGRDLVTIFPEAFEVFSAADRCFGPDRRLNDHVFPVPVFDDAERQRQERELRRTDVAQPAIGAVSLAMAAVLKRFGLQPDVVYGHSLGELSALCAAGRLSRDTCLALLVARGRCMAAVHAQEGSDPGGMLAVHAPLADIEALTRQRPDLTLANRNSPLQGVLSGSKAALAAARDACRRKGFKTTRLPVAAAFHSPLVADALQPFAREVARVPLHPGKIPVFANQTAAAYPEDALAAQDLLSAHLGAPVDFVAGIRNLSAAGVRTFVEVGPRAVLSALIAATLDTTPKNIVALDASSGRLPGVLALAQTLARLAALGYAVRWDQWERPPAPTATARMQIALKGANYRRPTTAAQPASKGPQALPAAPRPDREAPADVSCTRPSTQPSPAGAEKPGAECGPTQQSIRTMKNTNPTQPAGSHPAWDTLQAGLQAIERLQAQTAAAHQKFLETQAEASRALQAILTGTAPTAPAKTEPLPEALAAPTLPAAPPAPVRPAPLPAATAAAPGDAVAPVSPPPAPAEALAEAVPPQASTSPTAATLLEIVSHLTGYPADMLGLEMDIEADLGIDSIKRVEILSTLEERMPHLPAVEPDMLGSLKTLGQIVAYLDAGGSTRTHSDDSPKPAAAPAEKLAEDAPPQASASPTAATLLEIVSHLTGYPADMLGLEMDIEADLGIDSIKRVEILSTLEERMPHLPAVQPDMLGNLKTLGQIVAYLDAGGSTQAPPAAPSPTQAAEAEVRRAPDVIARLRITPVESPLEGRGRPALDPERVVYVLDDGTGLSAAIVDGLEAAALKAVLIGSRHLQSDLPLEHAGGLILVPPDDRSRRSAWDATDEAFLKACFRLTRRAAPELQAAAANGGALLATVTRMDGAFGCDGPQSYNPLMGALAGLAKTAALEWNGVVCRALDLDPQWHDTTASAAAVVRELLAPPPQPAEIALGPGRRRMLQLEAQPLATTGASAVGLERDTDVVVITGGAKGVTAAAARALAAGPRPVLVLLGRSRQPESEPEWLASLSDEAAVKQALRVHAFDGATPTPAELQKAFKARMADREIAATLADLRASGATAAYYPVDVRDEEALAAVLADVRATLGPIRGLIHGAGTLADRLIVDKRDAQFERVFDTKVKGLRLLLQATRDDDLKQIVLFSSVAARMGNRGQVDYAMANEALNKIARQEAARRPHCKVTAINWGPWDGGMVSPHLKRAFERRNVTLIPLAAGARQMVAEMAAGPAAEVEVVVGGPLPSAPETARAAHDAPAQASRSAMALSFKRDVDVHTYPVLKSHVLAGKPVVPLALMTEWIGHGALHANPGLVLQGLDDLRVLKGIQLDESGKTIRLMAAKAQREGSSYWVDVEIRNGFQDGIEVVHSRARAILAEAPPAAPAFSRSPALVNGGYPRSVEEVYADILFHGRDLHGIREILGLSAHGMVARLASAPLPAQWIRSPLRSAWIGDPLALDCAFQMATVWCFEQAGAVSLPSYCARYRQYTRSFPRDGLTAVLEVREKGAHKIRADITLLDGADRVVAQLSGYEAVMDTALMQAFKPAAAAVG